MRIEVENLGKKFRNEWIFRRFNFNFSLGNAYAITGPNGSGKSTFLQVLSGFLPTNEGVIKYYNHNNSAIEVEDIFRQISYTSPLLELIEEFTLVEHIQFHTRLKPLQHIKNSEEFMDLVDLKAHAHKQIKFFSSGMKQKLKLGLCLFSNSPILFLDEPTTNLDINTKKWFLENINMIKQNKLIILASNDVNEYSFTQNILDIQQFK